MTPAIKALERDGTPFETREYTHDPRARSYGIEAAEALGIDPDSVYKTLLAELDGREMVVAIVPVNTTLNLKSLAKAAGAKRGEMADPAKAERTTGFVRGGISPFGQKKRLRTFVDARMTSLQIVHVSGGRRGLEIAIAPQDLITATSAVVASL